MFSNLAAVIASTAVSKDASPEMKLPQLIGARDIIFVISTSLLGGDEPNFGQFSRTALFVLNGLVLAE